MKVTEEYYHIKCPKCGADFDCAPEVKKWIKNLDIMDKIFLDLNRLLKTTDEE